MIEEKAKQFEKRPPSQFQQSKFYFRGGDVLHEQEYLHDEYRNALAEYRVAESTLKMIENQVQDARDVLDEREGYTKALAAFLESDTELSTKSLQQKQRLQDLEAEIEEYNKQISVLRAQQNPATLGTLQKEKAYYMIEIQRGDRMIESYNEQRDNAKKQIAACSIHGKYRNALELEYENEKCEEKNKFLKQLVSNTKNEFDSLRPVTFPKDKEATDQKISLSKNIEDRIRLLRMRERAERRGNKHTKKIDNLINQIEELNDRMCEIGLDEDVVETDELRTRCVKEDYSEDENEEEEEKEGELNTNGNNNKNEDTNNNDNKSGEVSANNGDRGNNSEMKSSDEEPQHPSNVEMQSDENFERVEDSSI